MPNKSYEIGYRFEKRVQKYLEKHDWLVFRQGKSAFPDLICFDKNGVSAFFECKVNQYLSKEEKERAKYLMVRARCPFFVAHRPKKYGKIHFKMFVAKVKKDEKEPASKV